nr:mitogen-activated protein kinase kinase kinase 6 isoform X1 [Zootoca vivipara]XP_034976158.1 mitogen-activated protein kinase kinase kinase 6 isoform X1 [Zootoca vivipara]XP_034976159.1 mitogen-activated protein kinase kinase kinase 6 isoform X1 [Zootoca vivipara]XP_034976160.1 mitogen-activated protein kinase kinase kinase 6 isoform X1 [Zootoca vivipara]
MEEDSSNLGSAGSLWQDPLAIALTPSKPVSVGSHGTRGGGGGSASNGGGSSSGGSGRGRPLSVVYIFPDDLEEPLPLQCLREACKEVPATELTALPFGTVALGDTAPLDTFYNADVVVVEMSNSLCQPSLFYHLGVRESFSMTNNILLCCYTDFPELQALREEILQKNSDGNGSYTFIPYMVTAQNKVFCCDPNAMMCLSELCQPNNFTMEAFFTPLTAQLARLLEGTSTNTCGYFREMIRRDIRRARERYSGEQLSRELTSIQQRLDSVECLSLDIVMNFILSYRDAQDCNGIITLVETLQALPTCNVAEQHNICFHYAFALDRRNQPGDRQKALSVILPLVEKPERTAPDLYCMCGRIYKDMFIDSGFTDAEKRDQAFYWYHKAFLTDPSLHAGINSVVFLIAAGHKFETSMQLRQLGMKVSCVLGRKGSLEKMQHYWDVGFYLGASILTGDFDKIIQASEKLYKLNAPVWFLTSIKETYVIYSHFNTAPDTWSPKQELVDFWLGFLMDSCQPFVSTEECLVLILELGRVLQPSQLRVCSQEGQKSVTLSHIGSPEEEGISKWTFPTSSIRGISISKCDERCCFLYVLHTAEDFQLYFPTQYHCRWFCELVRSFMAEMGEEVNSCSSLEELEYDYERTEAGDRVILGKGTYGVVYAGRDLSNQVRIAIKEIPERDSRYSQPLHEEIALHKRLRHKNIVRYLGSVSQDGFLKIFMEEVPGGSLSSLLRSMWGPLKDNEPTIVFYTKQILEGLRYLHDNQIVHRDIKGDNVLINTYSGVLKISDFGTSKRLAGISPSTETFTGTLQYMAPEVIDQGPRGYGKPADIWSMGCTIIEMATGKPPFFELGSPQAAMFKVGMFKIHPEVPDSMSDEAKAFILSCFEADPDKRATAASLLQEPFLKAPSRRKSRSPVVIDELSPPNVPERSISAEGIGESQKRSSSLQSLNIFLSRSTSEVAQRPTYLRAPEELLNVDLSLSSSSHEESGCLFLLRKDSERRATLHKVLTEELPSIAAALFEAQDEAWPPSSPSPSPQSPVSLDHIAQLVSCLKRYIRSPNRKQLAHDLRQIQTSLQADGLSLCQLQAPLFTFQDIVKQALRKLQIKPHWVFALDNLMGQAVQAAFTILLTELKVKPWSSREEGHEHASHEEEESLLPQGLQSLKSQDLALKDSMDTPSSGIGTTSSSWMDSQHSLNGRLPLMAQLNELQAETRRLQWELMKKERECQKLLQEALWSVEADSWALRGAKLRGDTTSPLHSWEREEEETADPILAEWLEKHGADKATIATLSHHGFTLPDLLNCATPDDLRYTRIRGGMVCRLWKAILEHRQTLGQKLQPEVEREPGQGKPLIRLEDSRLWLA